VALKRLVSIQEVPKVTNAAFKWVAEDARLKFKIFGYKIGTLFILLAVFLLVCSHLLAVSTYFVPSFPDRAWYSAIILFCLGAAFAGTEVVESFAKAVSAAKSLSNPPANQDPK
jgi:hypothetical protein